MNDGTARTDWNRIRSMTDEEVHAAILDDPDVRPTDESFWSTAGRVAPSERKIGEDQTMTDEAMPEDRFWSLIDKSVDYEADSDRQLEVLRDELRKLSAAEIEAFERAFQREERRAYTWDLWGAAYVIHGGASDDGFEYFERWLISRGHKVFEQAVGDPDSLADMLAPDVSGPCEFEEFAYVAGRVWAEKTGIDPWRDLHAHYPYTGAVPAAEPSGEPFEDDAAYLEERYPKLWVRFGASPL
jgi:hypothetical protein